MMAHQAEPPHSTVTDHTLLRLYASALVRLQAQLDEQGSLSCPYPLALRRAFDLGAARNLLAGSAHWPTDLFQLLKVAQLPLGTWVPDMSWDPGAEFYAAALYADHAITSDCERLAVESGNPEQEIEENTGYQWLLSVCRDRLDGEQFYRAWRRALIAHPVIDTPLSLLLAAGLADDPHAAQLVEAFYTPVPEALAIKGELPLCTVSGTILRRRGVGTAEFSTECRNPEAVRRARTGQCARRPYAPRMKQLRRAFRRYWCLPGLTEIALAEGLDHLGWQTTLWPQLDRIDLVAVSPSGHRLASEVKDYLAPAHLARRFQGFKEYADDYDCYLVIPDYLPQLVPRYEEQFKLMRAAHGKSRVRVMSVPHLLKHLRRRGA